MNDQYLTFLTVMCTGKVYCNFTKTCSIHFQKNTCCYVWNTQIPLYIGSIIMVLLVELHHTLQSHKNVLFYVFEPGNIGNDLRNVESAQLITHCNVCMCNMIYDQLGSPLQYKLWIMMMYCIISIQYSYGRSELIMKEYNYRI